MTPLIVFALPREVTPKRLAEVLGVPISSIQCRGQPPHNVDATVYCDNPHQACRLLARFAYTPMAGVMPHMRVLTHRMEAASLTLRLYKTGERTQGPRSLLIRAVLDAASSLGPVTEIRWLGSVPGLPRARVCYLEPFHAVRAGQELNGLVVEGYVLEVEDAIRTATSTSPVRRSPRRRYHDDEPRSSYFDNSRGYSANATWGATPAQAHDVSSSASDSLSASGTSAASRVPVPIKAPSTDRRSFVRMSESKTTSQTAVAGSLDVPPAKRGADEPFLSLETGKRRRTAAAIASATPSMQAGAPDRSKTGESDNVTKPPTSGMPERAPKTTKAEATASKSKTKATVSKTSTKTKKTRKSKATKTSSKSAATVSQQSSQDKCAANANEAPETSSAAPVDMPRRRQLAKRIHSNLIKALPPEQSIKLKDLVRQLMQDGRQVFGHEYNCVWYLLRMARCGHLKHDASSRLWKLTARSFLKQFVPAKLSRDKSCCRLEPDTDVRLASLVTAMEDVSFSWMHKNVGQALARSTRSVCFPSAARLVRRYRAKTPALARDVLKDILPSLGWVQNMLSFDTMSAQQAEMFLSMQGIVCKEGRIVTESSSASGPRCAAKLLALPAHIIVDEAEWLRLFPEDITKPEASSPHSKTNQAGSSDSTSVTVAESEANAPSAGFHFNEVAAGTDPEQPNLEQSAAVAQAAKQALDGKDSRVKPSHDGNIGALRSSVGRPSYATNGKPNTPSDESRSVSTLRLDTEPTRGTFAETSLMAIADLASSLPVSESELLRLTIPPPCTQPLLNGPCATPASLLVRSHTFLPCALASENSRGPTSAPSPTQCEPETSPTCAICKHRQMSISTMAGAFSTCTHCATYICRQCLQLWSDYQDSLTRLRASIEAISARAREGALTPEQPLRGQSHEEEPGHASPGAAVPASLLHAAFDDNKAAPANSTLRQKRSEDRDTIPAQLDPLRESGTRLTSEQADDARAHGDHPATLTQHVSFEEMVRPSAASLKKTGSSTDQGISFASADGNVASPVRDTPIYTFESSPHSVSTHDSTVAGGNGPSKASPISSADAASAFKVFTQDTGPAEDLSQGEVCSPKHMPSSSHHHAIADGNTDTVLPPPMDASDAAPFYAEPEIAERISQKPKRAETPPVVRMTGGRHKGEAPSPNTHALSEAEASAQSVSNEGLDRLSSNRGGPSCTIASTPVNIVADTTPSSTRTSDLGAPASDSLKNSSRGEVKPEPIKQNSATLQHEPADTGDGVHEEKTAPPLTRTLSRGAFINDDDLPQDEHVDIIGIDSDEDSAALNAAVEAAERAESEHRAKLDARDTDQAFLVHDESAAGSDAACKAASGFTESRRNGATTASVLSRPVKHVIKETATCVTCHVSDSEHADAVSKNNVSVFGFTCENGSYHVFQVSKTGEFLPLWAGEHSKAATSCVLFAHPESGRLLFATGAADGSLHISDALTGTFFVNQLLKAGVGVLVYSNGRLLAGLDNGQVILWHVPSMTIMRRFSIHSKRVTCIKVVAIDEQLELLITGSLDKTVKARLLLAHGGQNGENAGTTSSSRRTTRLQRVASFSSERCMCCLGALDSASVGAKPAADKAGSVLCAQCLSLGSDKALVHASSAGCRRGMNATLQCQACRQRRARMLHRVVKNAQDTTCMCCQTQLGVGSLSCVCSTCLSLLGDMLCEQPRPAVGAGEIGSKDLMRHVSNHAKTCAEDLGLVLQPGHASPVLSMAVVNPSVLATSSGGSKGLLLWSLDTLTLLASVDGHFKSVSALRAHKGRLYTGSFDGLVRVFDVNQTGAELIRALYAQDEADWINDIEIVSTDQDKSWIVRASRHGEVVAVPLDHDGLPVPTALLDFAAPAAPSLPVRTDAAKVKSSSAGIRAAASASSSAKPRKRPAHGASSGSGYDISGTNKLSGSEHASKRPKQSTVPSQKADSKMTKKQRPTNTSATHPIVIDDDDDDDDQNQLNSRQLPSKPKLASSAPSSGERNAAARMPSAPQVFEASAKRNPKTSSKYAAAYNAEGQGDVPHHRRRGMSSLACSHCGAVFPTPGDLAVHKAMKHAVGDRSSHAQRASAKATASGSWQKRRGPDLRGVFGQGPGRFVVPPLSDPLMQACHAEASAYVRTNLAPEDRTLSVHCDVFGCKYRPASESDLMSHCLKFDHEKLIHDMEQVCVAPQAVLGVTFGTSSADIKKRWRSVSRRWHPDRNKAPGATAMFQMLSRAYASLTSLSS